MQQTPAMTSHKATWSSVINPLVMAVLVLSGALPGSIEDATGDLTEALTLIAALAIQAAVAWATVYYKRNFLK